MISLAVTLSATKDPFVLRARPFAALRMTFPGHKKSDILPFTCQQCIKSFQVT